MNVVRPTLADMRITISHNSIYDMINMIVLENSTRDIKQEMKMASIGFIGVGKLGQACAEMVAEVHDVVGYDVNPVEPENFTMVDNMEDAVKGQEIVFIAVPTPHDPQYDGKAPTSHLPNKDFDYTIVKISIYL